MLLKIHLTDGLIPVKWVDVRMQSDRVEIMRARAATSIQQGRLHLAAIYYAQSGLSFDEVALTLLHCLQGSPAVPASTTTTSPTTATANTAGAPGAGGGSGAPAPSGEGSGPGTLSPMVESNLSYFNTTASTAYTAADNDGRVYTPITYTSASLVDAAISRGCALTPLKVFLLQVLRSLPLSGKMQRTMVCTWLCDLYLHQISLARLLSTTASGNDAAAAAAAGKRLETADVCCVIICSYFHPLLYIHESLKLVLQTH